MPMSSGGRVASSSECATRPRAREIGLTGFAVPTQHSLLIGRYVMVTAEHGEPCDSRGSCTVLGAPGGEIPPGDSTKPARVVERADPDGDEVGPGRDAQKQHRAAIRAEGAGDLVAAVRPPDVKLGSALDDPEARGRHPPPSGKCTAALALAVAGVAQE